MKHHRLALATLVAASILGVSCADVPGGTTAHDAPKRPRRPRISRSRG